jgi:putative (di)nucleoside polyphosphate hydrolase
MSDDIDADGFRSNVGIVLMRGDEVFLGRRMGGRGWQFPQALYRELDEEIGLSANAVELIGQTSRWLRYRLPKRYVRRRQQPLCVGQKQRWFLLRLTLADAQFAFDHTAEPEFDAGRWAPFWEPVKEVIYFKRPVYARALVELAPLAFPQGQPALPAWWADVTAHGVDRTTPASA